MSYFVTGATGFIGRNLVERLLQREGTIYALVRAGSRGRLEELRTGWGADGARIVPVAGDLSQPGLGRLRGGPGDDAGRDRPLLPPGGDLRPHRRRRSAGGRQRRGHPARDRARRRDRGRLLPPGQLDRRRRPLQAASGRGHVRRGRTARQQPLLPHQARVRAAGPRGVPAALARLPAGDRGRRLAHRRDRQDRRPLLLLQGAAAGAAGAARRGCRRSGSRAARSTSSRSTTSPRRSTTSPTSRAWTGAPSTSPTPTRRPRARWSTSSPRRPTRRR